MLNSEVFTDKILEFAKKNKKKYNNNKPFPHIVIDDAIELNLIQEVGVMLVVGIRKKSQ